MASHGRNPKAPDPDPAALSGRRILVTGASGFLGTPLCRRLQKAGGEVHGTTRSDRARRQGEPHWWRCDVALPGAAEEVLAAVRPDLIVHLSGQSYAAVELELVGSTYESLATSTVRLLTAAARLGSGRFLVVASANEPARADDPPGSPYAAAKSASTGYGLMFQRAFGVPVVIARPFVVYGPGQSPTKVIPYVIRSLVHGIAPALSNARMMADWIYLDDVVEGLLRALTVPGLEGCAIDLGTGSRLELRAVVRRIAELLGSTVQPRFGALPDRPHERIRIADTEGAFEKLGWRARVPLDEGLRRTIEWVRRVEALAPGSSPPC
jgi:nucleoside-diphosphate-sugar epimerase